jgi:hypothetical protein
MHSAESGGWQNRILALISTRFPALEEGKEVSCVRATQRNTIQQLLMVKHVGHAQYTEEKLRAALKSLLLRSGRETFKQIAEESAVPRTTLLSYWNSIKKEALSLQQAGNIPGALELIDHVGQKKAGRSTVLSPKEEEGLVQTILDRAQNYYPMPLRAALVDANIILKRRGFPLDKTQKQLGPGFLKSFHRRWRKTIAVRKPEALNADRAKNTTEKTLNMHMDRMEKIMGDYMLWAHPDRIWNVDETGLQLGKTKGIKVLAPVGARRIWNRAPTDTRHLSVLFAINAAGDASPAVFVLPYQRPPVNFLTHLRIRPDWGTLCTGSGWITEESFFMWLKSFVNFLDNGPRRVAEEWNLLIMDQHPAHCSPRIVSFAEEHHVLLYYLPAHTTHYLQPLDVVLYSTLKDKYYSLCNTHETRTMLDIPAVFSEAWSAACTPANISKGFSLAGIVQFNREKLLERMKGHQSNEPKRSTDATQSEWIRRQGMQENDLILKVDTGTQSDDSKLTDIQPPPRKRACYRSFVPPEGGIVWAKDVQRMSSEREECENARERKKQERAEARIKRQAARLQRKTAKRRAKQMQLKNSKKRHLRTQVRWLRMQVLPSGDQKRRRIHKVVFDPS